MARIGIAFEQVVEAAEQVLAQGENVTLERVRHILGTGSHSTISKHVNAWKNQRLASSEKSPTSFTDPLLKGVNQLREQLVADVTAPYLKENETLRGQNQQLKQALEQNQHVLSEKQETLTLLQQEHEQVKREQLKHAILQTELTQKLAVQDASLSHLQEQLDLEQIRAKRQQDEHQSLQDAQRQLVDKLETQYHSWQQQQQATHHAQLSEIKEQAESIRHRLIMEVDDLKLKLKQSEQHAEKLMRTLDPLREHYQQQQGAMAIKNDLAERLDQQHREIQQISAQLNALHLACTPSEENQDGSH
jgi:chromosome segregation ATPase